MLEPENERIKLSTQGRKTAIYLGARARLPKRSPFVFIIAMIVLINVILAYLFGR